MNDWNNDPNDPWGEQKPSASPGPANSPSHDPYAAPQQPYQSGDGYAGAGLPRSSNGTLVLILGLCSWLMCGIFTSLPGWLIARGDRQLIQAGHMQPDSTLEAGYWINLISVIMTGLALLLLAGLFLLSFVAALLG